MLGGAGGFGSGVVHAVVRVGVKLQMNISEGVDAGKHAVENAASFCFAGCAVGGIGAKFESADN